jgi:protein-S-isoprenylcysteine O-methyltransferase Ste14
MLTWTRTLAWLACVVYSTIPAFWLVVHSRIGHWRTRKWSPYRILVPFWIGMWIVVGLISFRWRGVVFYRTPWAWLPAAMIFALGLWVYRKAAANFSQSQLYGRPEIRLENSEQRLVMTGIRARVRHPVYLGHLCEMLAWTVGSGLVVCFGLSIFGIATGAFMIRVEDAELEQRFGDPFTQYKESVPAVLPKLALSRPRL